MFLFLDTLDSTSIFMIGAFTGIVITSLAHAILKSKPYKPQTKQVHTSSIKSKKPCYFSNESLINLQQMLYHQSICTQASTHKMAEDLTRLENIHDFRTERAQFLARQYNIEPKNLTLYFNHYHAGKVIARLQQVRANLHTRLGRWSQPSNIHTHQRSHQKGLEHAFTVAQFRQALLSALQNSPNAIKLNQLGQHPILCDSLINPNKQTPNREIPKQEIIGKDATNFATFQFEACQQLLIQHLCNFYQLLTLLNCELLGPFQQASHKVPILKASIELQDKNLILTLDDILLDYDGQFYVPAQHELGLSIATSESYTKGVMSLVDLQRLFKMKISIAQQQKSGKGQRTTTQSNEYQKATATLIFPVKLTQMRSDPIQISLPKDIKEKPDSNELVASLTQDIDSIQLKNRQDLTIH